MRYCWLVWLGLLLYLPTFTWAATNPPLHFTHLHTEDGLSHNEALSIVQDDKGFIWIAATYGLNRYDGTSIVTYLNDNANPNSLPDNYLWDLHKGRNGILWIAAWGGGLSRFDLKTETFTNYAHDDNNPNSLGDNQVWSTYEDSKGRVWVATMSGLSQLEVATGSFTHYPLLDPEGKPQGATRMVEDQQGFLWVGTYGAGLHRFNPDTGKSVSYFHDETQAKSINSNFVLSVYLDPQQTLWAGTSKGLAKLPHHQSQFTRYRHDPKNPNSLSNDYIWSVLGVRSGELWLGTESGGLSVFNPVTEDFVNYQPNPNNSNSVSGLSIPGIYQDNNGYVWLATYDGVSLYNPDSPPFLSSSKSLSDPNVMAVYQDETGIIWLGTKTVGLYRFDPDQNRLENYQYNSAGRSNIVAIHSDNNRSMLWLGTEKGLSHFNTVTGGFEFYPFPKDELVNDLSTITTLEGEQDSQTLWVGSIRPYLFDKKSKQFKSPPSASDPLITTWIYSLLLDKADNLWIGSIDSLSRFNLKTGILEDRFTGQTPPNTGLSHTIAESLYQDSQGRVWIGTKNGLNQFDPVSKTFKTYFPNKGSSNNSIISITEDQQGKLWLASNKNLYRFDPQTGQFKQYDQRDGIPTQGFNPRAVFKNNKGELFFGGTQGLVFFDPAKLKENHQPPTVILTDLQLFHQQVKPAPTAAIQQNLAYLDSITLTHAANTFGFEFTALNYWSGSKNQYAYQLEGFDQDWIHTDSQHRSATYTNIAPGTYTFRVKASNNDGVWNEQGTSLQVVVLPPWWQTWWFKSISVALFFANLWLLYLWRVRAIRQRNQQLEQQVAQRTQELQTAKNAQEQFIATMSHELRTPLHAIVGLSGLLRTASPAAKQEDYLERLHTAAQHQLHLVGNVLDMAKTNSSNLQLEAQPFRLLLAIRTLSGLITPLAQQKGLALVLQVDKSLEDITLLGDRLRLTQVLMNLLGNAVKYTRYGTVTFIVTAVEQSMTHCKVRFMVEDTGIGIPADKLESLFEPFSQVSGQASLQQGGVGLGLAISKRLVAAMGGELYVSSQPDEGSQFTFAVSFAIAAPLAATPLVDITVAPLPAGLRVLLVDDAEMNRFVGAEMLHNMGVDDVVLAPDGELALLQLQQQDFDVVLLDISMPGMSGFDVTRWLRRHGRNPQLPVIALSSHVLPEVQQEGIAAGMDAFLGKPFEYAELAAAFQQVLTARHLRQ